MRLHALSTLVPDPDAFVAQPPVEPVAYRASSRLEFGLEEVDALLDHGSLGSAMVSQVLGGERRPAASYTWGRTPKQRGFADVVRSRALGAHLDQGATTVLEALHRTWRPLGDLCRRLTFETGTSWGANAYLTPSGTQGFSHHHDTHSVLIVQTVGSKTWQLHRPVLRDPLEHQPFVGSQLPEEEWVRLRSERPFLEVVLRAGDVLWIPRGWIHNGFATDEHSLHVSLAHAPLTAHWVVGQLVRHLDADPAFRAELPWGFARSGAVQEHVVEHCSKLLAGAAESLATPAVVDDLVRTWRSYHQEAARPPLASLASPVGPRTPVRTLAEAALGWEWVQDRALTVHLGDAVVRFEGPAAALVDRLLQEDSPEPWTPADIVDERLTPDEVVDLVSDLVSAGLVRRLDPFPS